jgi:protein-tyrosine phosphatase
MPADPAEAIAIPRVKPGLKWVLCDTALKVLFVCLGNICRSPLAEAVFNQLAKDSGLEHVLQADSAGTSNNHVGENPDPRTVNHAKSKGLTVSHKAQQFHPTHFSSHDLIVAMDHSNLKNIVRLAQSTDEVQKTMLLRDNVDSEKGLDVPDPWFGGPEGFEEVYHIIVRNTTALFDKLREKNYL